MIRSRLAGLLRTGYLRGRAVLVRHLAAHGHRQRERQQEQEQEQ